MLPWFSFFPIQSIRRSYKRCRGLTATGRLQRFDLHRPGWGQKGLQPKNMQQVIDQGVWGRLTWIWARVVDGMGLCVPACGRGMFLHAWLVGCWLPQQRTGTYWHNLTQSTLDFETTMPAFSLTYAKGWRQDKDRGQNFNPQTVCGLRMRKISGHLQQHLWILVVCCCSLIWCLL